MGDLGKGNGTKTMASRSCKREEEVTHIDQLCKILVKRREESFTRSRKNFPF